MPAVLADEIATPAAPPATAPASTDRRRAMLSLLPWLFPALAAGYVLHRYATPDTEILRYGAYFALAVALPGTLVHRALFGSRGNWAEDLGLGAATGLVVQLTGWALAAATGQQRLLPLWFVLVVAPFVAVPRLRRHWRITEPRPLPLAWSWALAAVVLLTVAWAATIFRTVPLPPATASYYPDILYHLALVHEMTRTMPFEVPQLAGDTLRYHYLSDADMATAGMLTGVDLATVYFRLWIIPIAATSVVVFAALARTVTGRWWAGALAAALAFVAQMPELGTPIPSGSGGGPLTLLSPSQTYSLPLIGLFALIAVEALRGRALSRPAWAALPLLALACAGAKSSALPPVVAGLCLYAALALLRRRRVPWTAVGLLAAAGFAMLAGFRLFAGGGAGVLRVQPLGAVRWLEPYAKTLGQEDGPALGGFLPPGVEQASAAGRWFVAGLVCWWLALQAPRLIGLFLPPRVSAAKPGDPAPRVSAAQAGDPAPWLFGGATVAALLGAWLLWHPSASQLYFYTGAIPFTAVLTVLALTDRVRRWKAPVAAAVAGAVCEVLLPHTSRPDVDTVGGWARALAVPLLLTAGVTLLAALATVVVWRRRAARALPVALIAALIGASLAAGLYEPFRRFGTVATPPSPPRQTVTAAEMRAALWLDEHAGNHDVVATNVHCMPMDNPVLCNARAFWVAGLGGRRTVVESWAYSDDTVAANGVGGQKYFYQPAPDREVFELNERVFRLGDAADLDRLRAEHGVRWLLADTRAGAVSPNLARIATVRHRRGPVTVYELR